MAYVDYKCLESLLIEGEDIIATEGLGSMIAGLFKNIVNLFMKAIDVIINCFKKLAAKLKRTKGKKQPQSVAEDRSAERDANIKKYEDETKQAKADFEENPKKRHEELRNAVNSLNNTMKNRDKDDDDDDEVPGSKITKDVLEAISLIEKTCRHANTVMGSITFCTSLDKMTDNMASFGTDKFTLENDLSIAIDGMSLYNMLDEKLTDSNRSAICDRLDTATTNLNNIQRDFNKIHNNLRDKLDNMLDNSGDKDCYNIVSRSLNRIQKYLVSAQKLAVELTKVCA